MIIFSLCPFPSNHDSCTVVLLTRTVFVDVWVDPHEHVYPMAIKGGSMRDMYLNKALTNELTAINQYWLHYRVLADWGVTPLADYERHESIDEMKHADQLIERILFLDGLPNLQDLNKLLVGENVQEMLECDLKLEQIAHADLKEAIAYCEQVQDYTTRTLFRSILDSEEEHTCDRLVLGVGLGVGAHVRPPVE